MSSGVSRAGSRQANALIIIMRGKEIQEKCSTCYVPAPACGRGGDDHRNTDVTRVFGVSASRAERRGRGGGGGGTKGREGGEKRRRAVAATGPLRPSKRVGWVIKKEGQVSCRLAAASHLGRELDARAVVIHSRSRGYVRVRMHGARVPMSRRHFDGRYVRIRERATYNSERTTWLMPLADS